MRRRWAILAGTGIAVAVMTGTANAADPSARAIRVSKATDQIIGKARLEKARKHRVRVEFAVKYPDLGSAGSKARMRVVVYADPSRRGEIIRTFERSVDERRGETVSDSVIVKGRAARALKRSGLDRRRTRRMLLLSSRDYRDIDGDDAPDFIQLIAAPGNKAGGAPTLPPRRSAALGGSEAGIYINNQSPNTIILTVAPVSCIYDNGYQGSHLSGLNDTPVASGHSAFAPHVQADAQIGDQPADPYQPDDTDDPTHVAMTPGYVDGFVNSSVKNFLFGAINFYANSDVTDPDPPNPLMNLLPDGHCGSSDSHVFVVGADRLSGVVGLGDATDLHGASLFEITGTNSTKALDPALDNTNGISVQQNGADDADITVYDGGRPPCGQSFAYWMTCRLPPGDKSFEGLRLTDLVIPGSHDSATSALAANEDWYLQSNHGGCSSYTGIMTSHADTVAALAFTQRLGMIGQLDAGIRYLDLRAAYDDGGGDDPGGRWRFLHTLFAQSSLDQDVQDIANWARAHPDEVLILDFNHVCGADSGYPDPDERAALVADLTNNSKYGATSLCDVAYRLPPGTPLNQLPATTLGEIRDSGHNVIVLTDDDLRSTGCGFYPIYDQTANNGNGAPGGVPINHLWPEEPGPGGCKDTDKNEQPADNIKEYAHGRGDNATDPDTGVYRLGTAPTIDNYRSQKPAPFTQTQTQYTLNTDQIIGTEFECIPKTLLHYEGQLNGSLRSPVILDQWGPDSNIVIGDDVVGVDDYIPNLINRNPGD